MTDDFLWGGINFRKFSRVLIRNIWMVIAIMVITYLGLGAVDKYTYKPHYTSVAVAAVYPMTPSYRYHTIETVPDLSTKTQYVSSVFNSDLFQSGLHNQDPSLHDCIIDSSYIEYTDLLVLHATSNNPGNAFKGIRSAIDYYSQFSGDMAGAPEIRIILGPRAPYNADGSSTIHRYRSRLCVLAGFMMAGLLLILYLIKRTYKTERRIRRHYADIRFYSLPFIKSGPYKKKRILINNNTQEPIKKMAIEIKQVLYKCKKKSLFVTSFADKEGGTAIISELAKELALQNNNLILIGSESPLHYGASELDASDDMNNNTLMNVIQQKCTLKDAMYYREDLNVHYIQSDLEKTNEKDSYSIRDLRHVLSECMEYADLVLINGAACYPSYIAEKWHEAVDATIALCRQEDADFYKVDKMLSDLQRGETYFAGCVLFEF